MMSDTEPKEIITSSDNTNNFQLKSTHSDPLAKKKKALKRKKTSKGGVNVVNVSKTGVQSKLNFDKATGSVVCKSSSKRKVPDHRSGSNSEEDTTEDEFLNCSDTEDSIMDTSSVNSEMFKTVIAALKSESMKEFMDTYIMDSHKRLEEKFEKRFEKMDNKFDNLKKELREVKEKLNVQEQTSRNNTLRITGLAETEEGVAENTLNAVKQLCQEHLSIVIPKDAIYSTYRIGKRVEGATKIRDIVINFQSHPVKMDVYAGRTKLRKVEGMKNLYINEDLTKMTIELLKEAKKRVNRDAFQTTWTSDGVVYLRLEEKGKPVKVENLARLDFYLKPKPQPSQD